LFFVIEGVLHIKTEWGTANVAEGEIFTTRPGEWHEFQTDNSGCRAIEVMYVKYDSEDIERKKVGGPMSNLIANCKFCGNDLKYPEANFCNLNCAKKYNEAENFRPINMTTSEEVCKCQ
jgi:hypothetical protein